MAMLAEVIDKNFHIDTNLKLKRNHEYYSQVQMQLHVLGLKQACFATWTEKDFRYEVIDIEENWMENMDKMVEFHKRWVCRELVTRELEGAPKHLGAGQHTILFMSETMECSLCAAPTGSLCVGSYASCGSTSETQ